MITDELLKEMGFSYELGFDAWFHNCGLHTQKQYSNWHWWFRTVKIHDVLRPINREEIECYMALIQRRADSDKVPTDAAQVSESNET